MLFYSRHLYPEDSSRRGLLSLSESLSSVPSVWDVHPEPQSTGRARAPQSIRTGQVLRGTQSCSAASVQMFVREVVCVCVCAGVCGCVCVCVYAHVSGRCSLPCSGELSDDPASLSLPRHTDLSRKKRARIGPRGLGRRPGGFRACRTRPRGRICSGTA